jgi:flagellar hook-length control protein FliK
MNIAMLKAMAASTQTQAQTSKAVEQMTTKQAQSSKSDANTFGKVFQSMMSSNTTQSTESSSTTSATLEEEVSATLNEDSLEGLLEQLGIEMDEAGLFVMIGEEAMPVPIDEMLNLENLSAALGLTTEELTAMIQQLVGEEVEITDVWSLIEQAPAILSEVMAAIQASQQKDNTNVLPKEVQQVVQVLKLAELLGNKVDTIYKQEQQLTQLKDALSTLSAQLQNASNTQQEAPKVVFQQMVQQVTQQTTASTQQTKVTTETETQQPTVGLSQQVSQTKTVMVTLPAEKSAQSETLVKEIQNIINRSQLSGQQGNMKLFLKLFPENLGQIRIELVQKDGVLTARLLATTAVGKELLENNINQLKAGFVSQNIQMDRIDVAQSLQDTDRNTRDQNFFNNFFRQNDDNDQDANQHDENEEESISFKDLLSEEV